jgi:hypothetical protein
MSIHSVTPNKAGADDPVKLTILADNLPRAGDLWVMFSTAEWSIKVRPEYQHNNSAVQVCTPKLYVEIAQQTRVEIRLVRISNQAETEPVEFTFWPSKKTQREPRTQTSILEGMLTNEGISSSKNEETELSMNNAKNIRINNKYT